MLVILDTNVILSALLSPSGAPGEVLQRKEAERGQKKKTIL